MYVGKLKLDWSDVFLVFNLLVPTYLMYNLGTHELAYDMSINDAVETIILFIILAWVMLAGLIHSIGYPSMVENGQSEQPTENKSA